MIPNKSGLRNFLDALGIMVGEFLGRPFVLRPKVSNNFRWLVLTVVDLAKDPS